jgi:hypothetical protein
VGDFSPSAASEEDLVEVRVQLPPTGESARTVSPDMAKLYYVDYQEVIFKVHGSTPGVYYIGTAKIGAEYLTVSVPVNKSYDVLYLGGWYKNRTLLATAFTNDADAADGYVADGEGILIKAGQANVIKLFVNSVVLDLAEDGFVGGTPDVSFLANENSQNGVLEITRGDTGNDIATLQVPSTIDPLASLKITITTEKFKDLIHAEYEYKTELEGDPGEEQEVDKSTTSLTFSQNEMVLCPPPDNAGAFGPSLLQVDQDNLPKPDDDSITYEYGFGISSGDAYGPLPEKLEESGINIDGALWYEFQYYGFGDPDSKSVQWTIKNGINNRVWDTNGEGGLIRLRLGTGSAGAEDAELEFHNP